MKNIAHIGPLLGLALGLAAGSTYGGGSETFDYGYTFTSPDSNGYVGNFMLGSFEGTLSGSLITNISDVTFLWNGYFLPCGPDLSFVESWNGSAYVDGGAVVSPDLSLNNFLFINSDYAAGDDSYTAFFGGDGSGIVQAGNAYGGYGGTFNYDVDLTPLQSNWSVIAVPDGGMTASLMGLSLAALAALRRRFAK